MEEALQKAEVSGKIVYSAAGGTIYVQTPPPPTLCTYPTSKGSSPVIPTFLKSIEKEWVVAERKDHPDFEFVVYQRR